ncbi:type VI secretion system baseplate subunit TssG [Thiorhodovibrio winogradskyi]|uniref:type VI secretion system baseplate subunit TssG n=1 Tax=Thiorhodovibrio winogradskyi TaxID=77007 RepID=UPI002E2BC0BE|nr:type VI secretion system baseplate subunit TssG [Thiorhodovibrio winogradskyi]
MENPRAFSFVQGVKVLRQAHGSPGMPGLVGFLHNQLRVRPELSLGFPATDMTAIREIVKPDPKDAQQEGAQQADQEYKTDREVERRFEITATFLGLYGPSSPLPTFYTEELLDEQRQDQSAARDFLDIVNHGFFVLYCLADLHYNLVRRVCTENDDEIVKLFYRLAGLGHEEMLGRPLRDPGALMRAIGLLTQFPRSAAGLEHLLADRIGVPVEVVQCEPRKARIPTDQRCALGTETGFLGASSYLGSEALDVNSKIRLRIGDMGATAFRRYRFGTSDYQELLAVICFFCTQPVEFDLEFILAADEAEPACLGAGDWSTLGCATWMAPPAGSRVAACYKDCRQHLSYSSS